MGDELLLDEVVGRLDKPICLSRGFITLVGGLAIRGRSNNDIDLLVKEQNVTGNFDMSYKFRVARALPQKLWGHISWMPDEFNGPFTDSMPLYDLWLVPSKDRTVIRMSGDDENTIRDLRELKKIMEDSPKD